MAAVESQRLHPPAQRLDSVGRGQYQPVPSVGLFQCPVDRCRIGRFDPDGGRFDHLRAEILQTVAQRGGLLRRPRDQNPAAEKRPSFKTAQRSFRIDLHHRPDHDHRRIGHRSRLHIGRQIFKNRTDRSLFGCGAPLNRCRRRLRIEPRFQKPGDDRTETTHPHVETERSAPTGQRRQRCVMDLGIRLARIFVPGDEGDRCGDLPMRQGNARAGGRGHGGGDARHHFHTNAALVEVKALFAAPAEHVGVPALQTHHFFARLGTLSQKLVDLTLRELVLARPLAGIDPLGGLGRQIQQGWVRQRVVDDHIRRGDQLPSAQADQCRVPRPGPHQRHRRTVPTAHERTLSSASSISS